MKKLMMFAAAMTIVGGAFAADCAPETKPCALVYYVKMNLRTSMGKGGTTTSGSICEPGVTAIACVRFPNYPYVINGVIATCDCLCDSFLSADACLWDPKFKTPVAIDEWTWTIHVIGNKRTAEAYWDLAASDVAVGGAFELFGAGFGAFNGKYYTAFSGYAAGTLDNPICQRTLGTGNDAIDCASAGYWDCVEGNLVAPGELEPAPLFGTWAIRLNPTASKRYLKDGYLPIPSYAACVADEEYPAP